MNACVVDADVLIAALDRGDAHHRSAERTVRALIEAGVGLFVSTVNYAEALVGPARRPEDLEQAAGAIAALGCQLVTPTASIARAAAKHRADGSVSLPDGFAIATAEQHAAKLATFDQRVRRRMAELGIESPVQLG